MTKILSGLWSKFQLYIAGGLLALAAMFCLLWVLASGKAEREREARLQAEDTAAEAVIESKRTQDALEASERRNAARTVAREDQRNDEAIIFENPVTRDCVASPAIRDALGILRERREGDTSERDSSAQPSNLRGLPD